MISIIKIISASSGFGLRWVPDASLDLREKTLNKNPRCPTGWVLHPKKTKGENPDRKHRDFHKSVT